MARRIARSLVNLTFQHAVPAQILLTSRGAGPTLGDGVLMHRILVFAVIVAASDAYGDPVPITTCGQQVTTRSAELVQDLDCSASQESAGVVMVNGGRVALNGFTLTVATTQNGVHCERSCRLFGPGTIVGGVTAAFRPGFGRIVVDGVTITGAGTGVSALRVSVKNSTLTGNGVGIAAYNPPVGFAIVSNSTITGSGDRGVLGYRIRLVDSAVTGSGGSCPPMGTCCDLASFNTPVLRGTSTCGTSCSYQAGGGTFGVCTND
jgi:hypothetical protein